MHAIHTCIVMHIHIMYIHNRHTIVTVCIPRDWWADFNHVCPPQSLFMEPIAFSTPVRSCQVHIFPEYLSPGTSHHVVLKEFTIPPADLCNGRAQVTINFCGLVFAIGSCMTWAVKFSGTGLDGFHTMMWYTSMSSRFSMFANNPRWFKKVRHRHYILMLNLFIAFHAD